jgi:CMP-N-acetylneuraminic acid synthetase
MIAIVPMKEISVRVPGKNWKTFYGKPLFYWIFNTLGNTRGIDKIVLTTDSINILNMVWKEFPFVCGIIRPERLHGNHIVAGDIIQHVLNTMGDLGDDILYTHSTNPLLRSETIERAISIYYEDRAYDSLMGVTKHMIRAYDKDHCPLNHNPFKLVPSQELDPIYEDNSNLYIFDRQTFTRYGRVGAHPYFFEVDALEAVDIDTEEDFILAEQLMKIRMEGATK